MRRALYNCGIMIRDKELERAMKVDSDAMSDYIDDGTPKKKKKSKKVVVTITEE
jgi:hypothetical protein